MKKIATLSIVFFAVIFLAGCGQQPSDQPKEKDTAKNSAKDVKAEVFNATLKVAIEKGLPIKCTEPEKENATEMQLVEGYFKGHKYYGELKYRDKNHNQIIEARILIVDNCMWAWNKGYPDGSKSCTKTTDEMWADIKSGTEIYNCMPSTFTDAKFTPPSDIKFAVSDFEE
jgi:hypothetical protein